MPTGDLPTRDGPAPAPRQGSAAVAPAFDRRAVTIGIGFVLAYQTAVVAAVQAAPVLAPFAALGLGLDVKQVGLLTALIFGTALLSSTGTAGIIARVGSLPGAALSLLMVAVGAVALALADGPAGLVLGAVFIGLGYGPVNPIGSRVLSAVASGPRRNLVFSFKQSSVAIGGALAGLILPAVALATDWRSATLTTAALAVLMAALAWPVHRVLGHDGDRTVSMRLAMPLGPVRRLLADPAQRGLAIAVFAFSMAQFGFMSVYVVMLWRQAALSPEGAALMLSLSMVASVVGRLWWGWRADVGGRPRRVLAGLAWSGTATLLLMLTLGPSWPWLAVALASIVLGFGPMGWSGVLLAEVARAGHQRDGLRGVLSATAGSMVFAYLGGLTGPAALSLSALLTGGYAAGILVLAAAFALCALTVARDPLAQTETGQ